jgi:hypothetical protein
VLEPADRAISEIPAQFRLSASERAKVLAAPSPVFGIDNIDAVRWDELEHQFGEATDIGRHLRGLATDDERWRARSLKFASSILDHQSVSGGVIAVCIPLLVDVLREWQTRGWPRADLADWLVWEAESAHVANTDVIREKWAMRKSVMGDRLPDMDSLVQNELRNRAAVREAFLSARAALGGLLDDSSKEVRDAIQETGRIADNGHRYEKDAK